ncbi:MAG: hypothetical protein DWQ02_01525, partial [Bacteroidetes bacterium]
MKPTEFIERLQAYLSDLPENTSSASWTFAGITKEKFTTPGDSGGWDSDTYIGYRFNETDGHRAFILRPANLNGKPYLAMESIHLQNQVVNYYLGNKNYAFEDGQVTITETFLMTVRHRRNKNTVREKMLEAGFSKEGIICQFSSLAPDFKEIINQLLKWAEFRETAKETIRSSDNGNKTILNLLEGYKYHLRENGLKGELYKWELIQTFQERPNFEVEDFSAEIIDIDLSNLVYQKSVSPVIHLLAEKCTEDYRQLFKLLFDERKSLRERINSFDESIEELFATVKKEENHKHQHDERTLATFLTYHNPSKYTFYKDTYYQSYCKLVVDVKPKKKGQKYEHYLELIEEFIEQYVKKDQELLELYRTLLPTGVYPDENLKLLAQDILYCTLERRVGQKRDYWRIGTTIEESDYWPFMQENGIINIGWPELGDLSELEIADKKEIDSLLSKAGYYPTDKRTRSRKAGEIFDFLKNVKAGDIVLAQNGATVLGIGAVRETACFFDPVSEGPHQKNVDWNIIEPELKNGTGLQTTVYQLTDVSLINQIDKLLKQTQDSESDNSTTMKTPLNQILYGPPGTGKTYNSIIKAVKIAKPDFKNLNDWSKVKEKFDLLIKQKQVVFTTFHQSMTYEDFVEGIKPVEPKEAGGQVTYEVEDGIFKKICKSANPVLGNFESVIESFKQEISETDEKPPITIEAQKTTFDVIYKGTSVFYVRPHASKKGEVWYQVNIDNIEKAFSSGSYDGVYNQTYVREIINFLEKDRKLRKGK